MTFENLFGIKESEIQNTCILIPFLPKKLLKYFGINQLSKGRLFASGNNKFFTLVHTPTGAPFVGDAILYLKETSCKNVILLGACGLVKKSKKLDIGRLVSPDRCLNLESFSQLLVNNPIQPKFSYADKAFLKHLVNFAPREVTKISCASFGSLRMEEKNIDFLVNKGIGVVDMECSAFFNAAKHINRKAIALMFVTDIIGEKPFYSKLNSIDQSTILSSIKAASHLLNKFISCGIK